MQVWDGTEEGPRRPQSWEAGGVSIESTSNLETGGRRRRSSRRVRELRRAVRSKSWESRAPSDPGLERDSDPEGQVAWQEGPC